MRLLITLAIIFIGIQNLDCHNHDEEISPRLNFFDTELLQATAENKKGNVMISPASIKSTLAMILAGAEGTTAKEIQDALRLSPVEEESRQQLRLYLGALRVTNTSTAVLKNANGVFVSQTLKLNPKYETVAKMDYLSEVARVDFSNSNAAAAVINNWVRDKTSGLIPFVVDPAQISQPTDVVLANALYFKSNWHRAFNPRKTENLCFHLNDGCKKVPMMFLDAVLNYAHVEDLKAHAVELPYQGKRYSMVLLVPLEKNGVEGLIRDLPHVGLSQVLHLMQPEDVILTMPKFTVNYNENLLEALTKLRITTLFSDKSNLTGIFEGKPSHVSSFLHKVYMSVDETGTVAAAATSAVVVPLMFKGEVEVRADKPFLFFIRDNELGITLFEGKVEEPSVPEDSPVQDPVNPVQDPVNPVKPVPVETKKSVPVIQSTNPEPESRSNFFTDAFNRLFG